MSRSGIHIKKSHQGLLRKEDKIAKGHKIPLKTLEANKKSKSAAVRKRATFALNARSWNKK
jgi:oligoendopeptidase F